MSEDLAHSLVESKVIEQERLDAAFPTLTERQISQLGEYGTLMCYPDGAPVWEAGEANMCVFVVAKGSMRIEDGRTKAFVARHEVGAFSGDVDVLTGRPVVVRAVAEGALEVLKVPADCVRTIVSEKPELGEILLKAFLTRRMMLQKATGVGVLVIGSRFSPDTLRIREFLARNRYPYQWEDLENRASERVRRMLDEFQICEHETPVVVLPNGKIVRTPSNQILAEELGVIRPLTEKIYDLVIIGAGPAGLAAGVYGASEGLTTLILDIEGPGGQAGTSSRIENYMGFPLGLSGQDLADRAVAQAEKFGAQMVAPARVTDVECNQLGGHLIHVEGRDPIESRCVVLAVGATYRKLEIEGMERFEGRGIFYAATNVERILCGERAVAIVGAGNSAGQAAIFMSERACDVYLVVRGDDLRKSMSSYLARRIEQTANIHVLVNSEFCDLRGEASLEEGTIVDRATGKRTEVKLAGVFVMIGAAPRTSWLPPSIAKDSKGFILTGSDVNAETGWKLDRTPFDLETTCPGVFAVGDVRSNSVKRVANAVGEGSRAVAYAHQYLAL